MIKKGINILDFRANFGSEESCRLHVFKVLKIKTLKLYFVTCSRIFYQYKNYES